MPRTYTTTPLSDRFWAKVQKTETCWLWIGSRRHGYGQIAKGGQDGHILQAHRVSWELHFGPIPAGMFVCHNCPGGDNTSCVRPDHLFLGTNADNLADMRAKGRYGYPRATGDENGARLHPELLARGDRSGMRRHPDRVSRGETNGMARLTEPDVHEIRRRYGPESLATLGREFGVTKQAIAAVVKRKVWVHI